MAKSQNYSFEHLVQQGVIPKDTKLLSKEELRRETLVYSGPDSLKNVRRNLGVVANGAKWVGKHSQSYFSYDGEFLWIANKNFIKNKLQEDENGSLTRIPVEVLTIHQKEEKKMENMTKADELLNAVQGLDADEIIGGGVNESAAFTDKELKAKQREERKAALDKLLAETNETKFRDKSGLVAFNRNLGSIIGYVVDHEPKVVVTTTKKFDLDANGNRIADESASPAEVALIQSKKYKEVKPSSFKRKNVLLIKQQGVGSPKGTIIQIPRGGAVLRDELVSSDVSTPVPFDDKDTDLVTLSLSFDQGVSYILEYFGGTIKENAATHQAPGNVEVKGKGVVKDGGINVVYKLVPSNGRKSLITKTNFLPRKAYKTVNLSEARSMDNNGKSKVNEYLFKNLLDQTEKYDAMSAEDKALFSEKDGVYSSDFINKNKDLGVVDFFSKEPIENPALPVKDIKATKSGKVRSTYVIYDVLNPDEELEALNPQNDVKYAAMVKALGGLTVKDVVSKAISVRRKGSKNSMEISVDDMTKLMAASMKGAPVMGSNLNITADTNKAIVDALAAVKYSK